MKCEYCQNKSPRYNMNQLCCVARHVLYRFYKAGESKKQYAIAVAKKYGVDVDALITKIKQMKADNEPN